MTAAFEQRAAGRRDVVNSFLPVVYSQLQALADRYLRRERCGTSLEPTDLVHEACLKLIDTSRISWEGKTHFLAVAAVQMRHILVDRARARRAKKRGGDLLRITLHEDLAAAPDDTFDVLALAEAIDNLRALSERQAMVIELRFFGGLTIDEVACALGVSGRTVREDARVARAWIARELGLLERAGS